MTKVALPPDAPPAARLLVRILPPRSGVDAGLGELWRARELVGFLAWRDIAVRYKQTFFGAAWAVIQPFFTMVVFSVFFGRLARIPSDGVPYPVFAFCGLIPWQLFANALTRCSNSLVDNERLIKKVYFPRLVTPVAAVLDGLPDFLVASVVLGAMMAWYGVVPSANLLWLPLFALLALAAALAVGLWLSALNALYRDVRYTLAFLTQVWMFATPVAYPASLVPPQWRAWYGLNPMAGVVEAFRWALLGLPSPPGGMVAVSAVTVAALLVGGVQFFRRMERTFADAL